MLWSFFLLIWISPFYAALAAFLASSIKGPLTTTGGFLLGGAVAMLSFTLGMLLWPAATLEGPVAFGGIAVPVLIGIALVATDRGWQRRILLALAGAIAALQVVTVAYPLMLDDPRRFFTLLFTAWLNGIFYPYWVLITLFVCFSVALRNQRLRSSEATEDQPL